MTLYQITKNIYILNCKITITLNLFVQTMTQHRPQTLAFLAIDTDAVDSDGENSLLGTDFMFSLAFFGKSHFYVLFSFSRSIHFCGFQEIKNLDCLSLILRTYLTSCIPIINLYIIFGKTLFNQSIATHLTST